MKTTRSLAVCFIVASIVLLIAPLQTLSARTVELAEDTAILDTVLTTVRSEGVRSIDLDALAALKIRLANREVPPDYDTYGRAELARAWKLMSALSHQLDGDTAEVLESLRIAYNLNPGDKEVKKELDYMQQKMDAANERLAEAARLREARAALN